MGWSWFEKAWLLPAWLPLGLSRLIILALPFRYLAPCLGTQAEVAPWIPLLNPRSEAAVKGARQAGRARARTREAI